MSDEQNPYKFDRTAFQVMTFEEADNHHGYWKNKSLKERWDAGCYLSMKPLRSTTQKKIWISS